MAGPTGDETAEADRDTVRRVFEAWNRHDVEGIVSLCHPGVRFHTLIGELEGTKAHRGHEGVRGWWAEVQGVFDDRRMDVEEITTRGEWVVSTGVGVGIGRGSGAEVRWPFVGVARLADGLLSEWRLFSDPKDARAFLGDSA